MSHVPLAPESGRVQMEMRGVRFHATDAVVFDIVQLRGELIPTDPKKPNWPPLGLWSWPKEPTQSCTWCTLEWYLLCW